MRDRHAGALVLSIILAAPAGAQVPPPLAMAGGGPGSDVGQAAAMSYDRMAVVGEFEQTATFGSVSVTSADAPAARSDVFLVMYSSPSGEALWARRMGTGVFNDFAGGVAFDNAGDVYVSGYFTGVATWDGGANPTVELTTRSDFDGFLAKYSHAGNLLWVQQIGGQEQDVARGVGVHYGDDAMVVGSFYGTATWGDARRDTTLTSLGSSDAFVARYAPDGMLRWVRRFGGDEGDDARAISLASHFGGPVGVFVAGTFRSVSLFGSIPLQSRGQGDLYAVRMTEAGVVEWAQQVGGGGFDYARGIATSPNQDLRLAGSFEGSILLGTTVLMSAGNSDAVVARLNPATGAVLDGVRIGGAGFDIANGVSTDEGWGLASAAVGYLEAPFTVTDAAGTSGPHSGFGGVDAFVHLVGSGFTPDSLYVIGGPDNDRAYGAGGQFNERIAVTGAFRLDADFLGDPLSSVGSNDAFVLVLPTNCGVCPANEPSAGEAPIELGPPAPNPAAGRATVALTLDRARTLRVELYDALGRRAAVLHEGPLRAGRTELPLDASRLAAGAYVLRAAGEGVVVGRRVAVR